MSALGIAVDASAARVRLASVVPNVTAKAAEIVTANAAALLDAVQTRLAGDARLANGMRLTVQSSSEGAAARVYSDPSVPYARIKEYGGKIHIPEIVPVAAKVLAFPFQGRLIFAQHTKAHMIEIPARPYMAPALDDIAAGFQAELSAAVADSLS